MRLVFRTLVILAVLALGAYLFGFWSPGNAGPSFSRSVAPVAGPIDTGSARGRLNQLEDGAGRVAGDIGVFMSDSEVSGKIKSKMALDELVRARTITVSTTDGVVTLDGTVRSVAEHDQAVRLAKDTAGAKSVVDRLVVVPASGH